MANLYKTEIYNFQFKAQKSEAVLSFLSPEGARVKRRRTKGEASLEEETGRGFGPMYRRRGSTTESDK